MTDHVLLPAQALPGLLQSGLPVIRGGRVHAPGIACDRAAHEWWCWYTMNRVVPVPARELSVDLCDPTVRDAIVRALWALLRPDDPEPVTAPSWYGGYSDGYRWCLDRRFERGPRFAAKVNQMRPDRIVVPALADIPSSDDDSTWICDLLALRAVTLHIGAQS